jgi:hypothetical protein
MKIKLTILSMLMMFNVYAQDKAARPSEAEVAKNRACFQELEVQGCRSQEEDPEQFRSCLANVHESLDEHCQDMLLDLYGE